MTVEDFCVAQELIEEIHADLDLDEDGITDEEVNRRKTRIFVGGLRFGSEDHVLHDYFDQFGPIKEAVVIRDRKTGLSKGYGFVTMTEEMNALKAISDKAPKLDGRRCNVNLAYIGQKKKPPSKKNDFRFKEIGPSSPTNYYLNGLHPPQLVTKNGHYPFLGLPPLHGCQPIYHFAPSPTTAYENHNTCDPYMHHSPMTPISPIYPQTIFFSQPMILSPSPLNNNNSYAYPPPTLSPNSDCDKNTIADNIAPIAPVASSPSSFTSMTVSHQPPDIVPITSHNVTGGPIIMAQKSPMNGNAIVLNSHHDHVGTSYQTLNNNNLPTVNGSSNTHLIQNNNHMINGNSSHLFNGNHVMNGHNSVTTFVTSPLASPSTHPTNQNHVFHYQPQQQHYLAHRDMIHQM